MASQSLYETFGNEQDITLLNEMLTIFIKNSTVDFPVPQASSQILGSFNDKNTLEHINGPLLEQIKMRLLGSGFSEANANALSLVLLQVSEQQNIHPFEFFELSTNTLKITKEAYNAINALRPSGNRVNLVTPLKNSNSRVKDIIKA
tara:strand:+ start:15689 stop:16129 length:441 start_codon:yes stop_codon:yes gene_type:complete